MKMFPRCTHTERVCQNLSFDRLYEVSNELTELLRDRGDTRMKIKKYEMTIEEIKKGM